MILITGASSGIGEACARHIAKSTVIKGDLILVARRLDRLKKLQAKIESETSRKCHIFKLDVANSNAIKAFSKAHKKLLGQVEVLISNAGLSRGFDLIQDGKPSDWQATIDTNLKGLLEVTHAVLPSMVKRRSGHIINMGSAAGYINYLKGNVYCATKAAVRALNECMRMDLLGKNIRVTEISPGMVETEFSVVRLGDAKKAKEVYAGMTPLTADDIAETIVWCLSRPAHVNIAQVSMYPTEQAIPGMVSRMVSRGSK